MTFHSFGTLKLDRKHWRNNLLTAKRVVDLGCLANLLAVFLVDFIDFLAEFLGHEGLGTLCHFLPERSGIHKIAGRKSLLGDLITDLVLFTIYSCADGILDLAI